ncbi:protein eva-1 homolog C isoform X2 [Brachyhypopomus gauderio]|uniref:protein eva-1 homolog C isoform X2 n=1 Tax=Brachyhypopomus gauderio TaxID=698409 RepID=UPI0040415DF1
MSNMISTEHMTCCSSHRPGWVVQILYGVLILWTKEMHGLSDFSRSSTVTPRARVTESACCSGARDTPRSLSAPRSMGRGRRATLQRACRASGIRPTAPRPLRCRFAFFFCQKMLSECQGHRSCQILVHPHVFGRDPCPGHPNLLHVSYSCKPKEHRNRTGCEGDQMLLHCRHPRVLNIYSAVYGRELGNREECLTGEEQPPPFECLYHGALDVVRSACYGKQRCRLHIDDERFQNPCVPGTKKYLTVLYSCVPQSLLKEANPNYFYTTSLPSEATKTGDLPHTRDSSFPKKNGIRPFVSSTLMTYGYITEHAEMAGLLFVSSVCLGLLIVLLAVSMRITRNTHRGTSSSNKKDGLKEVKNEDDVNEEEEESSEVSVDSSVSDVGRKVYCWEEVTYTTEAAELMERLERREMVIQEIRMNAYLNGTSCTLH